MAQLGASSVWCPPRHLHTHRHGLLLLVAPRAGASTPFSLQVPPSSEQPPLAFPHPLTLAGDRDSRRTDLLTLRSVKLLRKVENNPELATAAEGRDEASLQELPLPEDTLLLGKHPAPITHVTPQSLGDLLRGDTVSDPFGAASGLKEATSAM